MATAIKIERDSHDGSPLTMSNASSNSLDNSSILHNLDRLREIVASRVLVEQQQEHPIQQQQQRKKRRSEELEVEKTLQHGSGDLSKLRTVTPPASSTPQSTPISNFAAEWLETIFA